MPRHLIAVPQSEADFRRDVLKTLRAFGYLATAIRRSDGVTLGDEGLPDVIAAHPVTGAFLALELKVGRNEATDMQCRWLGAFAKPRAGLDWREPDAVDAPAADLSMIVRPRDWPDVARAAAGLAGHKVRS